jgi:hypothetical protein
VQATSNFHDLIRKERLRIAKDSFDNPTSFDTGNDMFNQNPNAGDDRVLCFFCRRQLLAFGLFLGLIDRDAGRLVALKPCILEEVDLRREPQLFDVTDALVVHATGIGLTQVAHQALFDVNDEIVLERMLFFYRCIDPSAP